VLTSAIWLNIEKIKRHAAAIISSINTLSFLLNVAIEPTGQKQALSQKYPCYYNKRNRDVCTIERWLRE
jgi:hypothetical protein